MASQVPVNTQSAPTTSETQTPTITITPTSTLPVTMFLEKPFPDVSKIEVFTEYNFNRWQERIFFLLDLHRVAHALTDPKPTQDADHQIQQNWQYANKEALIKQHTVEDAIKQKFVVGKFYQ